MSNAALAPRPSVTASSRYPSRIVCLTQETTETLYMLGEGDRVVGVCGYTVRPPEARRKPKVSAYLNARHYRIDALEPDLILGFSDLQADLASVLIKRGYPVMVFNQRSVAGILRMIRTLGAMVGRPDRAEALASRLELEVDAVRTAAARLPVRPRVFFEEWDNPLISGIEWVDELVETAGGEPIFPELRGAGLARQRIVAPEDVIRRQPDVIVASWCGKAVRPERIASRPGWHDIPAVRDGRIHQIKSTYILQPGPAALTEGLRQLHALVANAAAQIAGAPSSSRQP